MPKQRLHYQKSLIQKIKELFLSSFLASDVVVRTFMVAIMITAFFVLILASNYQNQTVYMGKPSPSTIVAQKEIKIIENDQKIPIKKGQAIVREGEIVSSGILKAVDSQKTLTSKAYQEKILITLFIAVVLYFLMGLYLMVFHRPVYGNLRFMFAVLMIIIATLTVGLLTKPVSVYFTVVPASAISMLLLFNPEVALVTAFICSTLTGLIIGNFTGSILGLLGSFVAIYTVSQKKERNLVTSTAIAMGSSLAVFAFLISTLLSDGLRISLVHAFYGLAGGLTSTIFAVGAMPFFENIFDMTTDYKLLELTHSSKPLLKKLMTGAPGTYNHSINVAAMVETVAPLIGADPLVAKAGALYHDIGKINRPYFFTENQSKGKNPHNHTKANLSYLIITAHVREGVEIAKRYNLPDRIVDIIKQHHGTTLVQYFYNLAKKSQKTIKESDYRYHEPKPNTKEAALVMLADSVEAAARSNVKPSAKRLEKLVKDLIQVRIEDHQLDESCLCLADVDIIKERFSDIIINIYHSRLKYPGQVVPFAKKVKNASTDK